MAAAYEHIWGVAQILRNEPGLSGAAVRNQAAAALEAMAPQADQSDWLQEALAEFRKVTASYWPGLFPSYDIPDLGRTNNDLEQFFGSWRWHERRATGRKGASRAEVLAGAASLASSLATRLEPLDGEALAGVDLARWRELRALLEERQASQRQRWAFRHDPEGYLAELQERAAKLVLPP